MVGSGSCVLEVQVLQPHVRRFLSRQRLRDRHLVQVQDQAERAAWDLALSRNSLHDQCRRGGARHAQCLAARLL